MPPARPIITWSEPGKPSVGSDFARKVAQAALHPVADHGTADLLGDGEADAHRRVVIAAVADEQDESGRRRRAVPAFAARKSERFLRMVRR